MELKLKIKLFDGKEEANASSNSFQGIPSAIMLNGIVIGQCTGIRVIPNHICKRCEKDVNSSIYLSISGLCVECMQELDDELNEELQ